MAEMDDDNSGSLEENEFLILLVKALGIKKRKIGPGQCDLQVLKDEGWGVVELRKVGYDCKDFVEAGYKIQDLMQVFAAQEFCKAGVSFGQLLAAGWNCARAKEAGYSLIDMVKAGASVHQVREAGFDDIESAATLRKQGVAASRMKQSGWPLSELKQAGYSATALRLAGFSSIAIGAVQEILQSRQPVDILRKDTMAIREGFDHS